MRQSTQGETCATDGGRTLNPKPAQRLITVPQTSQIQWRGGGGGVHDRRHGPLAQETKGPLRGVAGAAGGGGGHAARGAGSAGVAAGRGGGDVVQRAPLHLAAHRRARQGHLSVVGGLRGGPGCGTPPYLLVDSCSQRLDGLQVVQCLQQSSAS